MLDLGLGITASPTFHDVFRLISELEQEFRQCRDPGVYENMTRRVQKLEKELARCERERQTLAETLEHRDTIITSLARRITYKDDTIETLQHKLRMARTTAARSRRSNQDDMLKTPELPTAGSYAEADATHMAVKIETLEKENASLIEDVVSKKAIIAQLQKEAKAAQPLVNIGAAIRRRQMEHFLQQLREIGTLQDNRTSDQEIVERGDSAAHWSNIQADLALFECNILNQERDGGLLQQIYGSTVERCLAMCNRGPWQFVKAWDMSTIYFANRNFEDGPDAERFESLFERMKGLPKYFTKGLEFGVYATFDGCTLAEEILEEMEALTQKLMVQKKKGARP